MEVEGTAGEAASRRWVVDMGSGGSGGGAGRPGWAEQAEGGSSRGSSSQWAERFVFGAGFFGRQPTAITEGVVPDHGSDSG